MTQTVRYSAVALTALLLVIAGVWPFVSTSSRVGIGAAALVAYPVQVVAFYMLIRFWGEGKRFLLVWMGGTVARMGVILLFALVVWRMDVLPPAPTLLALAGFFFGLLLLETLFLGPRGDEGAETK